MRITLEMARLRLVVLTPRIASHATAVPAPFREDPADQIIMARDAGNNATISTSDSRILAYPGARSLW